MEQGARLHGHTETPHTLTHSHTAVAERGDAKCTRSTHALGLRIELGGLKGSPELAEGGGR